MVLVLLVLSTIIPLSARAHEVTPAIADVTLAPDTVHLEIELNLEAFIADIDLEGLTDTNAAPNAPAYDRLRQLPPADLEAAFRTFWPDMRSGITIVTASGATVPPDLVAVEIPDVGNPALPRSARLILEARAVAPVQIGWDRRYGALILRQHGVAEAAAFTGRLSGGELSPPLDRRGGTSEGAGSTFLRYVAAGFEHIVPKGHDHILFVLGLFFLAPRLGPLLWQVSAFTLAHTVTLALGALGWVVVTPRVVEPLIAASIVYVAIENLFTDGLSPWRPLLVFGFGLLHGLGFASVLGEYGLPEGQFVPALVGFNVGVEFGQLAVIAAAFLAVGLWFRSERWYRPAIAIPASCAIALVGAFWLVERVLLA